MPLSFGILLGFIILFTGVILHVATHHKKFAKILMGIGVIISLATGVIIVMAVNSSM